MGARPIDLHLKSLEKMGVSITEENNCIFCQADKLKGTKIDLIYPSVGATENIMLAAVLADGTTTIYNAAREPEIEDLQNFLIKMGAQISGAGTGIIRINGVKKLHDVQHCVIPDRIEAGTYLISAAITGGEIKLNNIIDNHLFSITSKLSELGCIIKNNKNSLYLKSPEKLKNIDIVSTSPYPGFPTDMQPQLMSLLTLCKGTSIIIETVFEARDKHVSQLKQMGADITSSNNNTFTINGVDSLYGCEVCAKDLRGGAALIIAGLAAEGKTVVSGSIHIQRGYEKIENILTLLGADIKFIE